MTYEKVVEDRMEYLSVAFRGCNSSTSGDMVLQRWPRKLTNGLDIVKKVDFIFLVEVAP